jgi:rod shape determining protein RodA
MAPTTDKKKKGVLRSIDYWTILIYVLLLGMGWMSVCGASYDYSVETDLLSLSTRSGMQIVWIGTSLLLALVIMLLDERYFDMFAYFLFGLTLVLLFATIFNPHTIKGSRSWLVLGPVRIQPAEFAKFTTALVLAKFMSRYGYDIHRWQDFLKTLGLIFLPMFFIVMQRETGSALVFLSFFLIRQKSWPRSI